MRNLLATIVAFGMISASSMSWATPIYGDEDLLKSYEVLSNSDPGTEATFVNKILGTTFEASDLVQLSSSWTMVDQSHGAFKMDSAPLWFLVKAGNTHYLYENNDSLDWAYVDFADTVMNTNPNGVYIANGLSHFSELGGGGGGGGDTPVPEPGTLMLLGAGLLGFAVYGKRRMNKKD